MTNMNTPESTDASKAQDCPNCDKCLKCLECLKVLQTVLDGEASLEEQTFVQNHITECSYCFDCYETDKTLRDTIKAQLNHREVPQDLIDCIKSKIDTLVE